MTEPGGGAVRPKFDAAFLERRMCEHKEWQEQTVRELAEEVVGEVAEALEFVNQVRTGKGPASYRRLK